MSKLWGLYSTEMTLAKWLMGGSPEGLPLSLYYCLHDPVAQGFSTWALWIPGVGSLVVEVLSQALQMPAAHGSCP